MDRRHFLQRLIMGLEEGIERTKYEIPFYKPDDLELVYAKKFLASMEENLQKSREELRQLEQREQQNLRP